MEDYITFLKRMKKLKPYIIKFDKNNSAIKPKVYFFNFIIRKKN